MFGYEKILEKLKQEVLLNYPDLVSLILFGSVARNNHRPDSDIDILLISENLPNGRGKRIDFFSKTIEKNLEEILVQISSTPLTIEINPILKTPNEVLQGGYIYLDMVEESKLLIDKENFFKDFLCRLKIKMENWGSKKVQFKNSYYWILKPDLKPGEVLRLDT